MHHVMNALKKSGHTNPALNDLFTLPLPPLTPNHGADLARQLISGECLQCDDLNTISELLANSVDCVPFYIQSIVKELAINKAIVTADGVLPVSLRTHSAFDLFLPEIGHCKIRLRRYGRSAIGPVASNLARTWKP